MSKVDNINNKNMVSNKEMNVHKEESKVITASGCLKEENNCYWRITSTGEKMISNFVINPVEIVYERSTLMIKVQFKTIEGKIYEEVLKASDLSTCSKFKNVIGNRHLDLLFKGRDDDLEEIKGIICKKNYITKKGAGYTGVFKHDGKFIFISPQSAIDSNGDNVDDVVYTGCNDSGDYSDANNLIWTNITKQNPIWEPELQSISKALLNFNDLQTTATIIGFCASCFLKERLYLANGTKFNHLIISGESGSGKSEVIENVVMPIFNTTTSTSAYQCTKFVMTKMPSSSNTIPLLITEYKPCDDRTESKNISELMRNAYDRTESFRGRPDQKINRYPALAPIILSGEVMVDETALLERSLVVCFSKSKIKDKSREESFKMLKENKNILRSLGRSLLEEALKIDSLLLIERQKALSMKIGNAISSRNKNAIINCMLGIMLLEDVYNSMSFDMKMCTGYSIEELFQAITDAVKSNVFDGKNEVNGVIENSLEVLDDMAELGILRSGRDYQVINSGEELALDVKQFYANYMSYLKSHNMTNIDMLTEKNYKKQLSMKSYFVDSNRTVMFKNGIETKRKKSFILNIPKLKEKLNLSNLYN